MHFHSEPLNICHFLHLQLVESDEKYEEKIKLDLET